MFIKNVSESAIIARVMGTKQPIEAGETVEMTPDEGSNVLAMYPKLFQEAEKMETKDKKTEAKDEKTEDDTKQTEDDNKKDSDEDKKPTKTSKK